jgi:PPOX class probable F420-dependent enzyme
MPKLAGAVVRSLREARVARLATVDARGRPHVVPIVFAYAAGRLYTPLDLKPKSVPPERLLRVRNIRTNPRVQVLIDRYDEDWRRLAFVQLRGRARLLEAGVERDRALRLLRRRYPQYAELPLAGRPVIRVDIERAVTWGEAGRGRGRAARRRGAGSPARAPGRRASRR